MIEKILEGKHGALVMKFVNRLNIRDKLFYGFGLVLLILILLSATSFINFSWVLGANKLNIETYQVLSDLDMLSKSMVEMDDGHNGYLITGDAKFLDSFAGGKKDFDQYFSRAVHSVKDSSLQKILYEINDTQSEWHSYAQSVNDLRQSITDNNGDISGIIRIVRAQQGKQYMNKITADISRCKTLELNLLALRMGHSNQLKVQTNLMLLFGTLLAVFIGMAIAFLITEKIVGQISQMVSAADKLALGDIHVAIDADSKDEFGVLARAFNKMAESIREQSLVAQKIAGGILDVKIKQRSNDDVLAISMNQMVKSLQNLIHEANQLSQAVANGQLDRRSDSNQFKGAYHEIIVGMNQTIEAVNHLIGEISNAAQQVAMSSKQVADSSETLSQGASKQATSLHDILASVAQIAVQTRQNADSANQANQLVIVAKEHADRGNEQMHVMENAMAEINEAATRISKITVEINDIATQTNILALNAAIEAARAGQNGGGFAVVADEIMKLSEHTANSAKETAKIIKNSIEKAETGAEVAGETARSLKRIVASVSQAETLMSDIAEASLQQAAAITEINSGIDQVSQITEINTATSEEGAAASEELSRQAEQLKTMVNKFQVSHEFLKPNLHIVKKEAEA